METHISTTNSLSTSYSRQKQLTDMNALLRLTTVFAIGVLLLAMMTMPAHAATVTVTNTNDSGPGSLRQALAVAHDGDRITFAVSGTITLTSGALVVAKNVTI